MGKDLKKKLEARPYQEEGQEQGLCIEGLSFRYGAPQEDLADWYDGQVANPSRKESQACLKDISFTAQAGELLLLTGESGCGKTTLLQIINGIIPEFAQGEIGGDVLFAGQSILSLPLDRRGRLTGSVFQNPRSQFFNVLVKDELRFGCENLNLPVGTIEKRIASLVEAFQLEPYLDKNLFHLSGGEKQRVACLSVAAMEPPVILYDEPSSNLDRAGMNALARLMRAFKEAGVIQILAEHRLAYVSDLVDKVLLMKEGELLAQFSGDHLRGLADEDLAKMGLRTSRKRPLLPADRTLPLGASDRPGRDRKGKRGLWPIRKKKLGQRGLGDGQTRGLDRGRKGKGSLYQIREKKPDRGLVDGQARGRDLATEGLYIESLDMAYAGASRPLLRIRDYGFRDKHIHALVAGNGIGKSSFLRALAGLEKRAKGYVYFRHQRYKLKQMTPLCSLVFQDVNHQLLTESVYRELLVSMEDRGQPVEEKEESILNLCRKLGLADYLEAHPFALSGGQKQRLAFASALLMDRPILILDEPTSGLDLKHMESMAELLVDYARDHLVLLATHDRDLLHLLDAEVHQLQAAF